MSIAKVGMTGFIAFFYDYLAFPRLAPEKYHVILFSFPNKEDETCYLFSKKRPLGTFLTDRKLEHKVICFFPFIWYFSRDTIWCIFHQFLILFFYYFRHSIVRQLTDDGSHHLPAHVPEKFHSQENVKANNKLTKQTTIGDLENIHLDPKVEGRIRVLTGRVSFKMGTHIINQI